MATYAITIGGSARSVLLEGFSISDVTNDIPTATLDVKSTDGSYRPTVNSAVIVTEDGTRIFGGLVELVEESGLNQAGDKDGLRFRVQAKGYAQYAARRVITVTLAAGTLKSQLTTLTTYLSSYGTTLHASQADGPAMEELAFTDRRTDDILNDLAAISGWTWRIDHDNVLRMVSPGTLTASFNVTDGSGNAVNDVTVETTRNDLYANRIILSVNGAGPATDTHVFTAADGVTSGGFIYFTTPYPSSLSQNDAWPNQLILNGTAIGPVGFVGISVTDAWDWDAANHRLRYTIASGATFPSGADTVTVTHAIGYPFSVQSDDAAGQAAYGLWERRVVRDVALSLAAAQDLADGLLVSYGPVLQTVHYDTRQTGVIPGNTQTITLTKRNLSGTALVQEVNTRWLNFTVAVRSVSAVMSAVYQGTFRGTLDQWMRAGSGGGGGGSVVATGASGGAPDLPTLSVQSNQNGAFYGDANFLHDPALSGADYGVEVLPAQVAIGVTNEASQVLALWNQATANGVDDALTFWIRNNGEIYVEHDHGTAGLNITDYTGAIQIGSGRNIGIGAGSPNAYYLGLGDLVAMRMTAYAIRVITSTPFTVDVAFGGVGETVYFWNHSANGTINLPALTALNIAPTALLFRQIVVKNITTLYTCTIDPNSTEVIYDGATSATTLALLTGESVTLQARTTGWYVVASHGRPVAGAAPGAHATTHQSGGSDAIKLDDLATPDDNTDLNASTTRHGLLPKLPNNSAFVLDGVGTWVALVLWSGFGSVGNVGTGEDTLLTKTLAANGLSADGMSLSGRLSGAYAANANNKTLRVKWNGTTFITLGPAAVNTGLYEVRFTITRISSTNARVSGFVVTTNAAAAIVTSFTTAATIATTWTGTVDLVVTGEGTADNDITLTDYKVMREAHES